MTRSPEHQPMVLPRVAWLLLAAGLAGCGSVVADDDDQAETAWEDDGATADDDDARGEHGDAAEIAAEDGEATDSDGGAECAEGGTACDDGNPCTDDRCDPVRGCVWTPNSAACDDGDPCSTGDTCRDGACRPSSILPSWHPDEDGDTYGDPAAAVCTDEAPAGHVADGRDCCDTDGNVHPDQTVWFPAPRDCGDVVSFDYDCDGVEEPRWTDTGGGCSISGLDCLSTLGWEGTGVPACGSTARWVQGCLVVTCIASIVNRTQECR